jgi:cytoskeleton protein RodZ
MMEETPVINTSAAPEATGDSLGRLLREAREAHGLSIADVAAKIKLAERQIEALEADDYTRLPELAFVRGFVRSYAKVLGLDSETMLKAIPGDKSLVPHVIPASVEVPFPSAASIHQKNLIVLAASLFLAVVVVAFVVWHFTHPAVSNETVDVLATPNNAEAINIPIALPADMQIIEASAVVAASAVNTPVSAVVLAPTLAASAVAIANVASVVTPTNASLRLTFTGEESWVEIKDKDGRIISSQTNLPGSELALSGNAPFSLIIAHAASVSLYYKGKQIDLASHTTPQGHVARLILD